MIELNLRGKGRYCFYLRPILEETADRDPPCNPATKLPPRIIASKHTQRLSLLPSTLKLLSSAISSPPFDNSFYNDNISITTCRVRGNLSLYQDNSACPNKHKAVKEPSWSEASCSVYIWTSAVWPLERAACCSWTGWCCALPGCPCLLAEWSDVPTPPQPTLSPPTPQHTAVSSQLISNTSSANSVTTDSSTHSSQHSTHL